MVFVSITGFPEGSVSRGGLVSSGGAFPGDSLKAPAVQDGTSSKQKQFA
ncbi:unnamed protein product, partial [Vitis vinifera]